MDIWEDCYKSGRWIVSLTELEQQSNDILLTFDSGNKEQGVITIAIPLADYQKAEPITDRSACEIKAFSEGKEARKACHVKEGVLPTIMLNKRAFTEVPITALRATVDYWNEKDRNHLVGTVTYWSIRKH